MTNEAYFIKSEKNLFEFLEKNIPKYFQPGSSVLVKVHMGEPKNRFCIRPEFTARIAGVLSAARCEPFVFDTPVAYSGCRSTVKSYTECAGALGYNEDAVGAPVIISDEEISVKGRYMTYGLSAEPLKAGGVLLLSHFKGHIASGMGASIKNVGMGCMSKKTKGAIHSGGEPVYQEGCIECNACVESCPTANIRIMDGRPVFDCTWCSGCSRCVLACPQDCIAPKVEVFDRLLSDAAVTAHERFKSVFAVNVMKNITRLCDCMDDPGPLVAEDIGFVCGGDMLTADIASLEILKSITGIDDLFEGYNKCSSWGHVREAARLMERDMKVSIRNSP